jgi:hypothetical protein
MGGLRAPPERPRIGGGINPTVSGGGARVLPGCLRRKTNIALTTPTRPYRSGCQNKSRARGEEEENSENERNDIVMT